MLHHKRAHAGSDFHTEQGQAKRYLSDGTEKPNNEWLKDAPFLVLNASSRPAVSFVEDKDSTELKDIQAGMAW